MKHFALAAALSLVPALALADPPLPRRAEVAPMDAESPSAPLGFVLTFDLGGGGRLGAGSDYTPRGLFESELVLGYELGAIRPQLGLVLGLAPNVHTALRPGLQVSLPDGPFYVRGALDWSTVRGSGAWRWLLLGAGTELRLTDVLGGFAEADLGFPLGRNIPLGVLVRFGVSYRF